MFALAVAASTTGRWPIELRNNLFFVVLIQTGGAIAVGTAGMFLWRRLPVSNRVMRLGRAMSVAALATAILFVVTQDRHLDGEIAAVKTLLAEVSSHAHSNDTVVLDGAAYVNNMLTPVPIAGRLVRGPWSYRTETDITQMLSATVNPCGNVYVLMSHSNNIFRDLFARPSLGVKLVSVWEGAHVGLYRTAEPASGRCGPLPALDLSWIRARG
jgi:hypothetical protein